LIKVVLADITKLRDVDYICNAANGEGSMEGGVARAIADAGGQVIVERAISVCSLLEPKSGELYITTAGNLPFKVIIHLVTMQVSDGHTDYATVRSCLRELVSYCQRNNISKVALPALGTGVGGLALNTVASIYIEELSEIPDIEFLVVDVNKKFIANFQ
jgi:O-acetyl-ADP-ribose deacetylase (regulator of RNase III)